MHVYGVTVALCFILAVTIPTYGCMHGEPAGHCASQVIGYTIVEHYLVGQAGDKTQEYLTPVTIGNYASARSTLTAYLPGLVHCPLPTDLSCTHSS